MLSTEWGEIGGGEGGGERAGVWSKITNFPLHSH